MDVSVEALWSMPVASLLDTYHKARRLYAEKKFARDTERARLGWQSARVFIASRGGVTERNNAVEASEELAKKGQHVREMTLDLDLLKADVDVMVMVLRHRGEPRAGGPAAEATGFGETTPEDFE